MNYSITIIWWSSGFWKWLTSYILREYSSYCTITITGWNAEKVQAVASEMWVKYSFSNVDAVMWADIVIYSAPISKTKQIILDTLPHIKPWAIISDVTSIKWFPSEVMERCEKKDVCVIPTHPMFGPYIQSIAGQVIVLTAREQYKKHKAYKFLCSELKKLKARVIETSPDQHDQMMAVVQWLTHLNMFTFARTLERLQFDVSLSLQFVSPIYKLMLSSVGRYLSQSPWLYADIQMYNSEIIQVQSAYQESIEEFQEITKNKDINTFCSTIESSANFVWTEVCNKGQAYTDKMIYLLGQQIERAKISVWKYIQIRDIYSGEVVSWILRSFTKDILVFENDERYHLDFYEII